MERCTVNAGGAIPSNFSASRKFWKAPQKFRDYFLTTGLSRGCNKSELIAAAKTESGILLRRNLSTHCQADGIEQQEGENWACLCDRASRLGRMFREPRINYLVSKGTKRGKTKSRKALSAVAVPH